MSERCEGVVVTDALAVLAASWGVLMALSPILQVRRMVERRSSADISIAWPSWWARPPSSSRSDIGRAVSRISRGEGNDQEGADIRAWMAARFTQ